MQSLRNKNKNDMTHDSGCQPEPFASRSGVKLYPCPVFLSVEGTASRVSFVPRGLCMRLGGGLVTRLKHFYLSQSFRPIRLEFNSVLPLFLPPVVDSSTLSQYNRLTSNVRTKPERERTF